MAYESPKYTIERKEGAFEIRHYTTFKTISTPRASMSGYSGFNDLFSYISGNNQSNTAIKMTVPVVNTFQENTMSMEFVLPVIHQEGPPLPNQSDLEHKTYTSFRVAVLRFKGHVGGNTLLEQKEKLLTWLRHHNIPFEKPWYLARYQPPYLPGFFKHNEIWIKLGTSDTNHKNEDGVDAP